MEKDLIRNFLCPLMWVKKRLGTRFTDPSIYFDNSKDFDKRDQVELLTIKDPFQLTNIAEEEINIRRELTKELEGWLIKLRIHGCRI